MSLTTDLVERTRELTREARYSEAAEAASTLASYQRRHDQDSTVAAKLAVALKEVLVAKINHRAFNAKAKRVIKLIGQLS